MKKTILISICLVIVGGCGSPYHVNVDSISSGELLSDSKCIILPIDPNAVNSQLQFKEYSQYIKRALEKKGYNVVDSINEAQLVIFLKYGISEPKENIYSYSMPVWGQTGVSSSHSTGTIHSFGGGMASYSGSTTYMPNYGITGYQTHIGTRTAYTRYIILDAYNLKEYRKTNKEVQLWKTIITSTGSSGDLRRAFPVMIAASKKYVGENTGKQVKIVLFENDKKVQEIKGLLGQKIK